MSAAASIAIKKVKELHIYTDGEYRVKDEKLKLLFLEVKRLLSSFVRYEISNISCDKNKAADRFANEAHDQGTPAMSLTAFLLKS